VRVQRPGPPGPGGRRARGHHAGPPARGGGRGRGRLRRAGHGSSRRAGSRGV
ncbi:MAG: hypothetical protein AVDCRST_MAG13-3137, partial [uncultured Solirubrobacteraceae bacterium]